jgi:multiple sugar transport system substrate-binding protein
MSKSIRFLLVVSILGLLLAACGPTPEPEIVRETEIVKETVVVKETVEVEVEVPSEPEIIKETVIVEEKVEVEVTAVPEPEEPVTLRYFTFSAAPDHLEHLDQMIAIFEGEHPNIQIEVQTAPWDDYFTKLQTMIAGGIAPDVFELNYENFVSYAAKGVLRDLEPLAAADADFDEKVFYPRAEGAFNYNGMQLGLPETFSTVVLFYNKDLFDQAGLDYPASDWTWDDAVAAAEQLTDADAGVWGLYSPIQFWEFYKKAAQNNCEFFSEDMTEVTINSPECVEAVETMVGFVEAGVMPSDADMGGISDGDMFVNGQIAMDVTGIWMFAAFEGAEHEWDIQVEPGMQEQATHFFANALSVFAATEHSEEAWQWARFFSSSPEVAAMRVNTGWELPALNNPAYFEDYMALSPPETRAAVFESLEHAIVPPVIERQNEMTDIINGLLEQVKLGQLTAQEALDQAKLEIEELLP